MTNVRRANSRVAREGEVLPARARSRVRAAGYSSC